MFTKREMAWCVSEAATGVWLSPITSAALSPKHDLWPSRRGPMKRRLAWRVWLDIACEISPC
jgi:hypothetical protein